MPKPEPEETEAVQHDPYWYVSANRSAVKYSRSEQLLRVLWAGGEWLIRLSPRPLFGWRRAVLRLFGAQVGPGVRFYSSTRFYMPWNVRLGDYAALGEHAFIYSLGQVTIGAAATVSYRAHICAGTHDLRDPTLPLLKPPVVIEPRAWIGTEAFIGPGVVVGTEAVIGARAVVVRSVAPNAVMAGNPARQVGTRRLDVQAPIRCSSSTQRPAATSNE